MPEIPDLAPLQIAQQLDAWGYNVLPAAPQSKTPLLAEWRRFQTERSTDMLPVWFRSNRPMAYFAVTGWVVDRGVLVLDCENDYTVDYWRERLGDAMDQTRASFGSKGGHWHWAIDGPVRSWSVHEGDLQFDVRADKTGVILPPSLHPNGHPYRWTHHPDTALLLPADTTLTTRATVASGGGGALVPQSRSTLAGLLAHVPDEGGRNDWLTKVCGHYAKQFHFAEDAYLLHAAQAASMLVPPLDPHEVEKTVASIWRSESERVRESGDEIAQDNGWLLQGDREIRTLTKRKRKGEDDELNLEQWADFDVRALGVTQMGDRRTYDVEILPKHREGVIRAAIPAKVFGSLQDLRRFFAGYDCTILPPKDEANRGSHPERLLRYLKAQNPPEFVGLPHLGWHEGIGYVTHEGVIGPDGLAPPVGVVPDPILKQWAPFRYGFEGTEAEARALLAEVFTFHHTETAAVFGAWWAACFIKPQLLRESALFPAMLIEAPSGVGKSNGYFALMLELQGNYLGGGEYTVAQFRDFVSAHRNGAVWADDMSQVDQVLDLLRQATSEGHRSKKGQDRYSSETVRLVAPIVVSGEGLGAIHSEKALVERSVVLHVDSPTDRMSLHGDYPQWDDIQTLHARHGKDLTSRAGWMVQIALRHAEEVLELFKELRVGKGREADRNAVLRVGARLLDLMTGGVGCADAVDAWVNDRPSSLIPNDNALTREVLPALLRHTGWPLSPQLPPEGPATCVFAVSDTEVWFHTELVADAYLRLRGHAGITPRVHNLAALDQQRKASGITENRRWTYPGTGSGRKGMYWRLDEQASALVLQRSGLAEQGAATLGGMSGVSGHGERPHYRRRQDTPGRAVDISLPPREAPS